MRDLEDLILETIYEELVFAKLDQAEKIVQVDYAFGRDVRKEQLVEMQKVLASWLKRSEDLIAKIGDKVQVSQSEWKMNSVRKEQFEKDLRDRKQQLEVLLASEMEEGGGGRRRRGPGKLGAMGMGGVLQGLMRGFRN